MSPPHKVVKVFLKGLSENIVLIRLEDLIFVASIGVNLSKNGSMTS